MRRPLFVFALLLVAAALPHAAAAQDVGNESVPDVQLVEEADTDGVDCSDGELIDRTLRKCSESFQDGTARIVLESDRAQTIEFRDLASFMTVGEPTQRELRVPEGQFSIVMDLEVYDRQAGIAIVTSRQYYPIILQERITLIGGSWSVTDARLAGIYTAATFTIVMVSGAILAKRGEFNRIERVR